MKYSCALLVMGALTASSLAQTDARLLPITTRGDGVFDARALSADGSAVAGTISSPVSSPNYPGFVMCRWTLAAGLAVLPRSAVEPTERPADYPVAISTDGSVLGGTAGFRYHKPTRWSLELGFQTLPHLDTGFQQTDARAMSASGRFLVGRGTTNNGSSGFLADFLQMTNANLASVGLPPTTREVDAWAISENGSKIVGTYSLSGSLNIYSCIWENGATCTTLVPPPGHPQWFATRMSGDGSVLIGRCNTTAAPNEYRPFRQTQTGHELLALPPNATNAFVEFVDRHGQTLAGDVRINDVPTACMWLPGGAFVTIDDYCDQHNLPRAGLHFSGVLGLSADGKVLLVGGVQNDVGQVWMLRLPGALPLCASDLGGSGGSVGPDGHLDNNDFITFIAYFFARNARADVGRQGGFRGSDFTLDNNDFIVFINQFFDGCL